MIAGQHAEAAGKHRQALGDTEFGGKIGHEHGAGITISPVKPRGWAVQIGIQVLQRPVQVGEEGFVLGRSLEFRLVPIDPAVRVVICDSMVRHALAGGEYNLRRQECERGVALLAPLLPGIRALRDVSAAQLAAHADALPALTLRRCRHVVTENERVLRAAAALEAGRVEEFGRLMNESHRSMRDDYEISCPELDVLVELAWREAGVLGSRMTGGGFGGSTVSMVRADAVEPFRASIAAEYRAATGHVPDIFICSPGDGVGG